MIETIIYMIKEREKNKGHHQPFLLSNLSHQLTSRSNYPFFLNKYIV